MLNLITRDITYTLRSSDYTQDVYVDGIWVASAKNNHSAEETADEIQIRQLDGGTICATCAGEGDCPDCDPTFRPELIPA